jgi:hypothetical protein
MLTLLFGMAIGLVVGWNLLPQPQWVKTRYDRFSNWFRRTFM